MRVVPFYAIVPRESLHSAARSFVTNN